MSEPTQINAVRADKANDRRMATPLETLKQLVSDIESGKVEAPDQIYIEFFTFKKGDNPLETFRTNFRCAGASYRELIALLELAKRDLMTP